MKSISILLASLVASALLARAASAGDAEPALIKGPDNRLRTQEAVQAILDDADVNRKCHTTNGNYIPTLKAGTYASSAFFNCFRTSAQIFEFVDTLTAQNTNLVTKFPISTTFKGQTIYAYKLSAGGAKPQAVYYESLLHAREWVAGSSNVFTFASFLDDLANGKPTITTLFDVIFVPIVNIDGYDISWNGNRYQRKNANQVDLNRNFPSFYKNPNPPRPSDETYPGPFPFSEPETKGIADWLKANNDKIAGWVDVHSYAGLVLYPYGDTYEPIGGGEDEKFQLLGRNIQVQMGSNYKADTSASLYPAYGCFDDYHYRTYKKPVLTLEIAGSDFVAPASTIRTRGTEVYKGLSQFAREVITYNNGPKPSTAAPTTTKVTPTPSTTKLTPKPTSTKPTTKKPTTTRRRPFLGQDTVQDEVAEEYTADAGAIIVD